MKPVALWVPLAVADLDRAHAFYTGRLGLSEVDRWERPDGERGVVLRVPGPGVVELVQPGAGRDPAVALALEFDGRPAVEGTGLGTPVRHPRGHYVLSTRDPDGNPVLIWSER